MDFLGEPLIGHTIKAGLNSAYLDVVVVSTDDIEIADVARSYGAHVVMRPQELAQDESPTIAAVIHAMTSIDPRADNVVLLQPTSPLRSTSDIDSAIELYVSSGKLPLAAVSKVKEHPRFMRRLHSDGRLESLVGVQSTVRRQDLEEIYRINGAIYIDKTAALSLSTSFNDSPVGYAMEQNSSIDIDEIADLVAAAAIVEAGR